MQKIGADFAVDRFLQRFTTNPDMAAMLARMPVLRVDAEIPAFQGLEALLQHYEEMLRCTSANMLK